MYYSSLWRTTFGKYCETHSTWTQKATCTNPSSPDVRTPSALTTAWHIQTFVDAADHEGRVSSLLLLKKGGQKTIKAIAALDVPSPLLYTANDGVTDKRHFFYFNTLLIQSHWVGLIQVAIHWYKPGLPELLLGCLQYFVYFLIKEEAPPV